MNGWGQLDVGDWVEVIGRDDELVLNSVTKWRRMSFESFGGTCFRRQPKWNLTRPDWNLIKLE
jgi:hypothetical protein